MGNKRHGVKSGREGKKDNQRKNPSKLPCLSFFLGLQSGGNCGDPTELHSHPHDVVNVHLSVYYKLETSSLNPGCTVKCSVISGKLHCLSEFFLYLGGNAHDF